MIHRYQRNCYRIRDGRSFVESLEMTGEQVAAQTGKSGNRADFLELLNRWNRQAFNVPAGMIYVYFSEITSG